MAFRKFLCLFGFLSNLSYVVAEIHMCPVCSDQSPVLGKTGDSYNLEKLCCTDGTVWVKYGLGNQGSVWTQNPEELDANEYKIISASEIIEIRDLNYVGYAIESDVVLEMKEDDSYHPSYINLLYLGAKNNETWRLQEHSCGADYDFTLIKFVDNDHSRLECTPHYPGNDEAMCGMNNLPGNSTTSGMSAPAVITKIHFLPQGLIGDDSDYCVFDYGSSGIEDDRHRNAYIWHGSYYYLLLKLSDPDYPAVTSSSVLGCSSVTTRVQCGLNGFTEKQCQYYGCCWDSGSTPNCFHTHDDYLVGSYSRRRGDCNYYPVNAYADALVSGKTIDHCEMQCDSQPTCQSFTLAENHCYYKGHRCMYDEVHLDMANTSRELYVCTKVVPEECGVAYSSRVQCLSDNVTEEQCTAHSCCYDIRYAPHCYQGNPPVTRYRRQTGSCVGTSISSYETSMTNCKKACSGKSTCLQMEYDFYSSLCALKSDQCQNRTKTTERETFTYDKVETQYSPESFDVNAAFDGDYSTCALVDYSDAVKLRIPWPHCGSANTDFNVTITGKNLLSTENQVIYVYKPDSNTIGASRFEGSFTECSSLAGATETERKYSCACPESRKCDAVYLMMADKIQSENKMQLCEVLLE